MSESLRREFECDPLSTIDHADMARMMIRRLERNDGPVANLETKLFEELYRPGAIEDFSVMLATLASQAYVEDGEPSVEAAKSTYLLGAALALEVLDAIAFDRRISLADYRLRMVGQNDTVTSPLRVSADDNEPVRMLFYIGQAVIRQGEDEFRDVELPYQGLSDGIIRDNSHVLMRQPFESAFGMVYAKGKQAQVALVEASYDTLARKLAGPQSEFDQSLMSFLDANS